MINWTYDYFGLPIFQVHLKSLMQGLILQIKENDSAPVEMTLSMFNSVSLYIYHYLLLSDFDLI